MAASLSVSLRHRILDLDLTLDLERAPVTVLFGPSGSGKTTLLRCLAGLDRPADARITFGGEVWDGPGRHLPARRRRIGYLFQEHALFPHLDVAANVGYGLVGMRRRDRPAAIEEALDRAGAGHLRDQPTRTLSGGEAQRVALARALAPQPQLLLLDEPLSALDAPTRARLRGQLRSWLVAAGVPAILVTHDRAEAMATGDRIAVMVDGEVRQVGAPAEVFSFPSDQLVADAVDMETVVPGVVLGTEQGLVGVDVSGTLVRAIAPTDPPDPGSDVLVCIRAEEVALQAVADHPRDSPRNHLVGHVRSVTPEGPLVRVLLDVGFPLQAFVTRPTRDDLGLAAGLPVVAAVKAPAVHLVPRTPA
ncbi:MAG: ABC transporter ATP-binding protein [Actinobacteria bacterium]|nr:ABC transporter ATP-binding protein [Actinomycetota bacterium]MCB9411733.1 ABC transporter ATP-binding protein [Actinomycetota bacterium]